MSFDIGDSRFPIVKHNRGTSGDDQSEMMCDGVGHGLQTYMTKNSNHWHHASKRTNELKAETKSCQN